MLKTEGGASCCFATQTLPRLGHPALTLQRLDARIAANGMFYARFLDDGVILAPSRWKLRRAVRIVQQTLEELKVQTHPDKTFVGRVQRGFTFLGYRMNGVELVGVALPTGERFARTCEPALRAGCTAKVHW